ncbi:hypothetical protein QT341_26195 [Escherichia coli]|nr:hypothetical protein [Escherichia coli]
MKWPILPSVMVVWQVDRPGKEKLKSSIKNAVMYGGGSKEDAADTMNELLAAGD